MARHGPCGTRAAVCMWRCTGAPRDTHLERAGCSGHRGPSSGARDGPQPHGAQVAPACDPNALVGRVRAHPGLPTGSAACLDAERRWTQLKTPPPAPPGHRAVWPMEADASAAPAPTPTRPHRRAGRRAPAPLASRASVLLLGSHEARRVPADPRGQRRSRVGNRRVHPSAPVPGPPTYRGTWGVGSGSRTPRGARDSASWERTWDVWAAGGPTRPRQTCVCSHRPPGQRAGPRERGWALPAPGHEGPPCPCSPSHSSPLSGPRETLTPQPLWPGPADILPAPMVTHTSPGRGPAQLATVRLCVCEGRRPVSPLVLSGSGFAVEVMLTS